LIFVTTSCKPFNKLNFSNTTSAGNYEAEREDQNLSEMYTTNKPANISRMPGIERDSFLIKTVNEIKPPIKISNKANATPQFVFGTEDFSSLNVFLSSNKRDLLLNTPLSNNLTELI
jgi:hypothetical protein